MGKNSYFGAIVLAVVLAFLAAVGSAALVEGAEPTAVANEPITVDYDAETSVDAEGVEYDETVTVTANDAELEPGTDYDWNATTGSVSWFDTSATADGDDALIDYTVYQVSETSHQIAQITAPLLVVGAIVVVWIVGSKAIFGGL